MIGYITVGTNDLPRAASFYDKLFANIGGKRVLEDDRAVGWSFGPTGAAFGVCEPFDRKPATVGNGTMVALSMSNKVSVDALHRLALSLGAADDGAPGPRRQGFYAAYFRDLDGNKLEVYFMI